MVRSKRELDLDGLRGTTGRRRVGYCKLGRSISFNKDRWGYQGDAEAPQLLVRLAQRNPDVDWVVVGRNDGDVDLGVSNIINPWGSRQIGTAWGFSDKLAIYISTLSGMVIQHGQSGTSHASIPQSTATWEDYYRDPLLNATTPQDWGCQYAGFIIRGLNMLGDKTNGEAPVVWIVPDPRNYVKARDVKWPTGLDDILSQYSYDRTGKHERFRDPREPREFKLVRDYAGSITSDRYGELWVADHRYRYAGLELMILPDDWEMWNATDFDGRLPAGIATTSFAVDPAEKEPPRSKLVRDWLLPAWPQAEVRGKWDEKSLAHVPKGTVIETKPDQFVPLLNRWRTTLALPALGSSWTTAKSYQCWAAGVVAFMVGRLDGQGYQLPTRRVEPGASPVGEVAGTTYYSIRDDWTQEDLTLASWLRVESPEEFAGRSRYVASDRGTWEWLMSQQHDLLRRRWDAREIETTIEARLGLR